MEWDPSKLMNEKLPRMEGWCWGVAAVTLDTPGRSLTKAQSLEEHVWEGSSPGGWRSASLVDTVPLSFKNAERPKPSCGSSSVELWAAVFL